MSAPFPNVERASTTVTTDARATERFLDTLYGRGPDGYLGIWSAKDRQTRWFQASDTATIARIATNLAKTHDVFFNVGLQPHRLEAHQRGKSATVYAIPGLYIDVDIQSGAHKQANLPSSRDAALALLDTYPLKPSVIVDTGHGIHAYLLFNEPYVIENDDDRKRAESAVRRYQQTVQATAVKRGWLIDSTHDLSRMLRLPGTVNHKTTSRLVRIIEHNDTRYTLDEIEEYLPLEQENDSRPSRIWAPGWALSIDERTRIVDALLPWFHEGRRHDVALGVSGWLAGHGVSEDDTLAVIEELADHGRDHEQLSTHRLAVVTTYQKARAGEDYAGWSLLTNPHRPLIDHATELILDDFVRSRDAQAVRDVPAAGNESGLSPRQFIGYMPEHKYIFRPTGDLWPASSVNSRLGQITDGEVMVPAAKWLDRHHPVEQMTWAPGEPEVIVNRLISNGGWINQQGFNCYNLYRAPAVKPGRADDAGRWIAHIHRVYPNEADHIIKWLAHRVQCPGVKVNHALVLGGQQGIGKDTLLEPVKHAVGPWNFQEVSPVQLLGRFNGFVKSVILRVSEARDLGDVDRYGFYEHLKVYTAAPPDVLRCDEKNIREYSVLNVCGVVITTNHKTDGIYLPADDRRHFVAWSECTSADFPEGYWNDLYRWYHAGGYGHVAAYLATLDISDFDAKAPPPKTPAFWDVVDASRAPEDAELADALEALGYPTAITLEQVAYKADEDFRLWLRDRKNARKIPHRMEAAGYVPVRNTSTSDGRWKVNGKNQVIYARRELAIRDRVEATMLLAGR